MALEEIGIAIKAMAARFSGIETRMETEAVDVAIAVARKLCSEMIAAEPLGEIMGLVKDCFSHLVSTPHIVVRINEQLYEVARERKTIVLLSRQVSTMLFGPMRSEMSSRSRVAV